MTTFEFSSVNFGIVDVNGIAQPITIDTEKSVVHLNRDAGNNNKSVTELPSVTFSGTVDRKSMRRLIYARSYEWVNNLKLDR